MNSNFFFATEGRGSGGIYSKAKSKVQAFFKLWKGFLLVKLEEIMEAAIYWGFFR